jgi:hypothetical protein
VPGRNLDAIVGTLHKAALATVVVVVVLVVAAVVWWRVRSRQ